MARRMVLLAGTLAVLIIAAVWGAFLCGIHFGRPKPLDFSYPENWIVILDANAALDRDGPPAHVQVGVVSRIEGEDALRTLRQNRITISDKQGVHTFMWPDAYAAGKCRLLDIDNDGVQEFLFSTFEGDDTYLRVVQFRGGKFQFRTDNDELRVATVSPEPISCRQHKHRPTQKCPWMPSGEAKSARNETTIPPRHHRITPAQVRFPSRLPMIKARMNHSSSRTGA